MRKYFFLLLVVSGILPAYSINTHWNLEPIVIKNIGNNTIYSVCYGSDGFMWLSTAKGVSRYDGFRFRDYPLIMNIDSLSTPLHQAVKKLREGPDGLYYVSLYQGGIACFDKGLGTFLPVHIDRTLNLKDILDFYWKDGNLYLATSQGLFESRAVRKTERENDYVLCILNPVPLVKGRVENLCVGGENKLYFSVDREKVMSYDFATRKASLIRECNMVNRLFFQYGYLWICRLWNDIICYDLKTAKECAISIDGKGQPGVSNFYITDLVSKDNKTFYLATCNGLYSLRFDNEALCESPFALTLLTRNEKAFEHKMTGLLWDDKLQILWVSTLGGGVVKLYVGDSQYSRVRQNFSSKVVGVVEDPNGYIWLSLSEGNIMKSTTPAFSIDTHFEPWEKASAISGRFQIYKDKNNNIWLGSNRGEIVFINPLTNDVESFNLYNAGKDEKVHTAIHSMCLDSWNRLWVGTSDGLMQVGHKTRKCTNIKLPEGIKSILAIAEDKEGNIWVGTDKGLKRLETGGTSDWVKGSFEKENGLEETAVRTIYVNNYNQIYVAYLNVLIRIDGREKDKIDAIYTLQNGLSDGHVMCMVDDRIGNTWAGNNVGVMTIRNGQEAFYDYLSVGNCNAVCRLSDGRLLWANSLGLIFFDPSVAKTDLENPRLVLTDVEVGRETIQAEEKLNAPIALSDSSERMKKLFFDSDDNDFRLFLSDLRYGVTEQKIAYRLLPADKDWKTVPLSEGLYFNGLPAGKYTLQAKLVFPDDKEGNEAGIHVIVKGNKFHSVWAYMAYVLLIIVLSYIFYTNIRKKEYRRKIYRNREQVLKRNLDLEKMKREQKEEMAALRNRLLMLSVQELRTPLSLIIAPLKELQNDKSRISNLSLQMAYRNSLRMVDACDLLLAIYRQDNWKKRLEVAPYSVEKVIDSYIGGIHDLLKVYPIDFHCEKRIRKEMEFYVNKKKIEFIIHNLLTNAFMHTHYAGAVSFSVCEIMKNNSQYVSLTVEDNGKKRVRTTEQLMGENVVLENDLSAAQLGFAIMQQMVEAHRGTILLESAEGKGTKVTINLPVDRAVLENDPGILFIAPEELPEVEPDTLGQSGLNLKENGNAAIQEPVLSAEGLIAAKEERSLEANTSKKKVLIVEDHKDIRLYLKVLFGNEYNLLMATNGQEGIDMAMKELPDLILCDVMMPVKDGFECCREVKECPDTCGIPFIMLTAKVDDDDVIHGLELGADDYVLKPFTPGILKAKVGNLINSRQALKQMYTTLFKLPGTDVVSTDDEAGLSEEEEKKEDPFITSVIKIVEENICEADFSVKKLAAEMNMSQPTLYRKVKQSTDYTIIELIRGVRMRRAGVLLKTKQYGVQEVAEMIGYNDIPTFRKHFVDAFGTTPSTYE